MFFLFIFKEGISQEYGLSFLGQEVVQEDRTGLDLTPNSLLSFEDDFELSFDLSFDPGHKVYFGYIFRLIDSRGQNIDLIYDERFEENKRFKVIIGETVSSLAFDIPLPELFSNWHSLVFKFNKSKNTISLQVGKEYYEQPYLFEDKEKYKIIFGASDYEAFKVTDVPSMKIKQIRIFEGGAEKYNWSLNDLDGNLANELKKGENGVVKNPIWIKKMHYEWQFLQSFSVQGPASLAFDSKREEVHVIGENVLASFSIPYFNLSYFPYRSGKLEMMRGNQSLYDTLSNRLYNLYMDQELVTTFNWETGSWSKEYIPTDIITVFWHHNKFYSPRNQSLYTIGGYGQYTYYKDVYRYNLKEYTWEKVATRGEFTPRYLAALGRSGKGAYILGGYGSASGQQFVNPKNLYDMVFFDEENSSFTKLFEIPRKEEEFAFANSMIIDEEKRTYYALEFPNHLYNTKLQLVKGSLDSSYNEEVGSEIPYKFHDIHSFADLYYAPNSKKFVAVTSLYDTTRNETSFEIYSLLGPPLLHSEVMGFSKDPISLWYWVALILSLSLGILFFKRFVIQDGKRRGFNIPEPVEELVPSLESFQREVDPAAVSKPERKMVQQRQTRNAIYLFGFMQLYDSKGDDITKLFSPLIKELFLLILLSSQKTGIGIGSDKLTELLWFDKTPVSARNNRSVNIAKLRGILDQIDGCVLTKETGYWKINLDEEKVYLDYRHYVELIHSKEKHSKENLYQLAQVTKRGSFLANAEYDWLDSYKSEISQDVVNTFLQEASITPLEQDADFIVELTSFVFDFDFVNEEAMVLKCKALEAQGKHSQVKITYENFKKEYEGIYGEVFSKSLTEILQ